MALEWLKQQASSINTSLKNEMTKFKNKDLMEGIVAGCALVAYADGNVSSAEKQKMVGFIKQSEALQLYDIDLVLASFTKFVTKFEFDGVIGKGEALQAIAKLKKKEAEARLLVRVCCAIGASDGNFDAQERATVSEICRELGLDPKDFDL